MSYQYPQAPAPAPPVDRDIQGILQGVEQRNAGWHRFAIIEPGKQYPVKVDTKKEDVIRQCFALMGQQVSASIREQESTNINPNNNRPYINRYLNAIAPAGYAPGVMPYQQGQPTGPAQAAAQAGAQQYQQPQPQPRAQMAPGMPDAGEKEMRILRETAGKIVAAHWQMLPPEQQSPVGLIEAAEAWVGYFVYGPLRFGVRPFDNPAQQETPPMPTSGEIERAQQMGQQFAQAYMEATAADGYADPNAPCPDCGFVGQHSIGCPRGEYS